MMELLSPAGEINAFKAAIENGANAIYMGIGSYNARIMANNFTKEEYIQCIHYAHIREVKVYLTLNTLLYDNEIKEAISLVIELYSHGLDAVIVQDIGVFNIIKKIIPELDIHASTQMSIHNLKQAIYFEKLGFKRIVLARELSIIEIENICKNTNLEIEVFIHGALCVSYSGQCLMSSMIGARSGNRGKCAGPCRLKYSMYQNGRCIEENKYLISKKDILGLKYIQKLMNIGVKSLKIEGRSKTAEYVGNATEKYRKCIDNKLDSNDKKELLQMFNRCGESSGYFEKNQGVESITINSAKNTGLKLGKVISTKDKYIQIKLEEEVDMHDGIEIYSDDKVISTIVTCIRDDNFKLINSSIDENINIWIGDISGKVAIGDTVFKTSSSKLVNKYTEKNSKISRKKHLNVAINILQDCNINAEIEVIVNGLANKFKVEAQYLPQKASNKSVDLEYIKNSFSKTINEPYEIDIIQCNIDDNLFVPVSKMNELRRCIINRLNEIHIISINVENKYLMLDDYLKKHENEVKKINIDEKYLNSLYIYEFLHDYENNFKHDKYDLIYINISDIYRFGDKAIDFITKYKDKIYLCIPNIVLDNLDKYIDENLEKFSSIGIKGILIGNIGYLEKCLELKQNYGLKLNLDYSLNVLNTHSALMYKSMGVDVITISTEIDESEIENIAKVCNIEIVENFVTAMTTRFCPIKSYSGNCNCTKNQYIIKDNFNNIKYNIICDNVDCTVKFVRNISSTENNLYSKRSCVLGIAL